MSAARPADLLAAGGTKLALSTLVLATGFRAVSDDDYARLVIAQRFAETPSLDPSGTSWLPFPFWVYGTAFALFGNGLGVARAVALLGGVVAALSVLVAARWLGADRGGALFAALAAAVFPWSAWLGAATLPEAPAAGLAVLGVAALAQNEPFRRALGAVALGVACFSRYEAWPLAVAFAGFSLADARRFRARGFWAGAVLVGVPLLLWLLHGAVRHGDALFFFARVARYKQALGGGAPVLERLLEPFVSLVTGEPVLVAAAAVALSLRARRSGTNSLAPYARVLFCALLLVLSLAAGALGGGAPTHHSARALLPVWYLACAVLGHAAGPWLASRSRLALGAAGVVLAAGAALAVLPSYRPQDFARRDFELHIGAEARRAGAPALLVDTPDFGYFAVSAAYGFPERSAPLDDRDPRKPAAGDAFASREALAARSAESPDAWLVATRAHERVAARWGNVRAANSRFVLVEPARRDPD